MDDPEENTAAVTPPTSKQILGFEFLNKLVPDQRSPTRDMEVQVSTVNKVIVNEELGYGISDVDNVGTESEVEIECEDNDESEPNPEDLQPTPKARPLNYPEESAQPLESDHEASETSQPKLIDDGQLSRNVSPKPSELPLKKEKLTLSDFFPDSEFTRQPTSRQSQSQPEPGPSSSSLHKTNPFRPITPKKNDDPGQEVESTISGKPSSHLEKSRVFDQAKAIDLFDWISPNTLTSVSPEVVSHAETSQTNDNGGYHNNPFMINLNPESAAIASSNAISKSKMTKGQMASLWDYRPPTPSKFQNCEVDSGNVDALVSHVLQSSGPPLTRVKSEHEGIHPNAENIGRRKSQIFNPGISINFSYNPVFTTDTTWTWNHQQPPGSSPSAYFTTDVTANTAPQEEIEVCQTPPYLLNHGASVSAVSLVPMVDSNPKLPLSASSRDDLSPEDPPSDSDVELPRSVKTSSKKSPKKSASQRNKDREELEKSPLGCRIIEILNQFNKITEDDNGIATPATMDNSGPSRTPSFRNVNLWDRGTSSHAMVNRINGTRTPEVARPTDSTSTVRSQASQGSKIPPSQSRSKFEPSSFEIKRNIVLENILLAKFPRRRSSIHMSLSRGPSTQILVQNRKLPVQESTNVSRTSSVHRGRVQPILTTVKQQQGPSVPPPRMSRPILATVKRQQLPVPPPRISRPTNPDNLHKSRQLHNHYHQQSHARIEKQAAELSRSRSRSLLTRTRTEAMVNRSRARIQEAQNNQARLNRIQNAQTAQSTLNQLGGRAVSRNAIRVIGPTKSTNANDTPRVRPSRNVQIPRNGNVQITQNQNIQNRQKPPIPSATATRPSVPVPSTSQNRPPDTASNREPIQAQTRESNFVLNRNVRKNQVNATTSVRARNSWTRKPNSEDDNV